MKKQNDSASGFSLVELLVGTILFTIVTGAVFSLLLSAQLRYQGESNVTEAFQQANVAVDQIVRDVHSAGYPPKNSLNLAVANNNPDRYALPFAWSPNYPATPCSVGGSCAVPGDYDLIVEADVGNSKGVQWIRYSMVGTTLMRGMAAKVPFADPVGSTASSLVPYLDNVMNRDKSVPIFSYGFDNTTPPPPPQPSYIREVNITLLVQGAQPDPQTGQFRTITMTGQAVRFNPNL
jgi:type II secretory pathway pseudopilin PulG